MSPLTTPTTTASSGADEVPRRADALRNIETIVDAAERCLARDPDASMSDIANEAGLGRVTIYGHFKSRRDLIEVVVRRVLDAADAALNEVDLTGAAAEALERLVEATWTVTVRAGSLVVAAEKALSPAALRDAHAGGLEERVHSFIARAQSGGEFRSDLPVDWLVATFHAVLHAAANEIDAGRLDGEGAAAVITATLLGAYQVPTPPTRPRRNTAR